jgi:acyl carrier protein
MGLALSKMPFLMETISPENVIELLLAESILEPQNGLELTAEADLFTLGLDSMALMQLLLQIELRFQVSISPAELAREHFATAAAIAQLLNEKRRSA